MNAENWATALSAVEEAVAAVPERAEFPRGLRGSGAPQNARHAVRLAIRARISGRDRPKISASGGCGHARLFDPARDNVLVEAFAMARSCQDTSWPWILRKRPTLPNSCPMGRSLSTTRRAAKSVREIKLVKLKTTSLDGAELIAGETEQHVPVLIGPATANYKSEVAFHGAFYAVQNE